MGFLAILFMCLVVADVSHASWFWKPRSLISRDAGNGASSFPPLPTPISSVNNSDPPPGSESTKGRKSPPPGIKEPKTAPNVSNDTKSRSPPLARETGKVKDSESNKDDKSQTNGPLGVCDMAPGRCKDGNLVACLLNNITVTKDLAVIVENEGEGTLTVTLTGDTISKKVKIPQHQSRKIPLNGTSTKLIVNSGNEKCELNTAPLIPENSSFLRLPSLDLEQLVTPINAAYLLILTVLIFGGTWACCKLRKKRRSAGYPYQELEMAQPESASATNLENAEGWDEGWDDDWDEENAVKSPGGRRAGSISANGLTARSSNKDGWENNWDD